MRLSTALLRTASCWTVYNCPNGSGGSQLRYKNSGQTFLKKAKCLSFAVLK